jgi:hypothetical protein
MKVISWFIIINIIDNLAKILQISRGNLCRIFPLSYNYNIQDNIINPLGIQNSSFFYLHFDFLGKDTTRSALYLYLYLY